MLDIQSTLNIQPTFEKLTYSQCHLVSIAVAKRLPYNLMSKGLNNQSFFINSNESWKVSSSFLELKGFTLVLSIEVLQDHVLALLLDDYV